MNGSSIFIDVALVLTIFLVRAVVLAVTAKAVSRGLADVSVKATAIATIFLNTVFLLANPTMQMDDIVRPFLVMALVGTLVCKRAFWIHLDQALLCSLVFCMLSIFLGDYPRREIDKAYPDRVTLNRTLAVFIDDHATHDTNAPAHEPSEDILTALVRASSATTSGVMGSMLGFFRAGLEAKAEVARLQKIAAQEAMIANLLAGGGTNRANRAAEMAALKEDLGDAGAPPDEAVSQGTNGTRHGYGETYAAAKAQLAEVNRIASNNAAIVNMLSGIGEEVTDRKEEMDKLHQALLAEAMEGHIDLSNAGEPISDAQVESLRKAMGMAGSTATTNAAGEDVSTAAIRKTLESVKAAAGVYAVSSKTPSGAGTNVAVGHVEMDNLHATLLDEALRGGIDLSVNGPPPNEKQLARVRKVVAARIAKQEEEAKANTLAGKVASAVSLRKLFEPKAVDVDVTAEPAAPEEATADAISPDAPSFEEIQAALHDVRKAAAAYTEAQREIAAARARARVRVWDRACDDDLVAWNSPYVAPRYHVEPKNRLVEVNLFESLRFTRAPWAGSLRVIRSSVSMALVGASLEAPVPTAPQSELIIVRSAPASTNVAQAAKPPPPSPYELLTREERDKWSRALQKIEVSGVVGSTADVAAIVGGKLYRRGDVIVIDSAGAQYSFRLSSVSKKGQCQWMPMVEPQKAPGIKAQKKPAAVSISL